MDDWRILLPYRRPPFTAAMSSAARVSMAERVIRDVSRLCRSYRVPVLGAVVVGLRCFPARGPVPSLGELGGLLDACVAGLQFGLRLPDEDPGRVVSRSVLVVPRRDDPYDAGTPRFILTLGDASVLAPIGDLV